MNNDSGVTDASSLRKPPVSGQRVVSISFAVTGGANAPDRVRYTRAPGRENEDTQGA